jgi:hypothetical protein
VERDGGGVADVQRVTTRGQRDPSAAIGIEEQYISPLIFYAVGLVQALLPAGEPPFSIHNDDAPTFYVNGVKAADGRGNFLPAEYFELALKLEIAKGTAK